MSFFDGLLGFAAPIIGGILGGPVGAAAGSLIGSGFSGGYETNYETGDVTGSAGSAGNSGAIASGVANAFPSAVSAGVGAYGQAQTNEQAAALAGQTMQFNSAQSAAQREWAGEQAGFNRDFQAHMSNTAWQRGVSDMKEAGLNPMLAFSQGGASSPSGGIPSGSSASGVVPSYTSPLTSAINTAGQLQSIERARAETDNIRADTALKGKQTFKTGEEGESAYYAKLIAPEIVSRVRLENEGMQLTRAELELIKAQVIDTLQRGAEHAARTGNLKVDTALKGFDIPAAKNAAEYAGRTGALDPALSSISRVTNSASDLARARYFGRR